MNFCREETIYVPDVTQWISTRDRRTWITIAEVAAMGLVLFAAGPRLRLIVGLPLLLHLGWSALTSLPVGQVPGPPPGVGERRKNHELRSRVVRFLNEVKRVENYVRQARVAKLPPGEVKKKVQSSQKRILATADEVVDAIGRSSGL